MDWEARGEHLRAVNMRRSIRCKAVWGACWLTLVATAAAPQTPAPQQAPLQEEGVFDPAEPDFAVVTLPTTSRLPRHKSAFRLTHRFGRPLGEGDFGDLVSDLFGFDSGAQVGVEFRMAPLSGVQIGIYRTNDKTIEFFGQVSLLRERPGTPVSLGGLLTVEGRNNFRDEYAPALGAVVSKRMGTHGAVYLAPRWIHHTNLSVERADRDDTVVLGFGGRLRLGSAVYLVGEFTPRVAGYAPGVHQASFGIEKRVGGHMFQLNISNALGTTPGQVARGGYRREDWFIGFNLTRKFF